MHFYIWSVYLCVTLLQSDTNIFIASMQLPLAAELTIRPTQLTYLQPAQNGVLTDQLCRAIYCIHLSIMPMQIAITITLSDNWSVIL